MTTPDADDAGLVERFDPTVELFRNGTEAFPAMEKSAHGDYVLYTVHQAQRREIEELRREIATCQDENRALRGWQASCKEWKGLAIRNDARADKAHAALAEAMKIIEPFAEAYKNAVISGCAARDIRAAAAFVAKHRAK